MSSGGVRIDEPVVYGDWGFDLDGMDRRVRPGDDFYRYANGTWLKTTSIPPDKSRIGMFDVLDELSNERVRAIATHCVSALHKQRPLSSPESRDAVKIGAMYECFMDEALLERLDAAPLFADLSAIRSAATKTDIARLMGRSVWSVYSSVIACGISDDAKDPQHYAVQLGQAGLGLPDRDYYIAPQFAAHKVAYVQYIADMLDMAGFAGGSWLCQLVVEFETAIARVSWTRAERRDDDKTYNPMSTQQLVDFAPGFPWRTFFLAARLQDVDRFIVAEDTAFPQIAALFHTTPIQVLQAWCAFHLADSAAAYLSDRFVQRSFEFHGRRLSGQPQMRPRWKRAVGCLKVLGEAVGRIYVQRHFRPEAKAKMDELVRNVVDAMRHRVTNLEWMTAETKRAALGKLDKFTAMIGYPQSWRDYSALRILRSDLYGNLSRSLVFEWDYQLDQLHKPVDRYEWHMLPYQVNAYYSQVRNQIVFPAAILQPPFFDPDADPAVNYGGIGGVIGHEVSHALDDQGSKYDGDGVLRNWWSDVDSTQFKARTLLLQQQYDGYQALPGLFIKGDLTLGENIGDAGGLAVTIDAYQRSQRDEGRDDRSLLDGFTGTQRVFLGWAQVWRSLYRDEAIKKQLVSDPHSPPMYRVNGVVRNLDVWYNAFQVQPTDRLYLAPTDRVRIW